MLFSIYLGSYRNDIAVGRKTTNMLVHTCNKCVTLIPTS